ncbi:Fe-S cluster assembly protein SufD [Flavobacteriales bacterium]|nr:Fe-S cluster assembly protein SufD [Flavobacteriales bacterium]
MVVLKENNLLSSLSQMGVGLGAKNQAFELLKGLEFPTRKTEDWRYTSVNKILKKQYVQFNEAEQLDLSNEIVPSLDAFNIVLVNGVYSKELSDVNFPDEIVVDTFPKALEEHVSLIHSTFNGIAKNNEEVFTALNTSYFHEGVFIHIPKKVKLEKLIHVIHVNTKSNVVSNVRLLIVADEFSEVGVVQSFASVNAMECLTNSVTEVFVKENAKVVIDKVQSEEPKNNLICTVQVNQKANSTFKINTATVSGDFVRNGVNIDVDGENCTSEMNGLHMQKGIQHVDNHTKISHLKPNCTSFELYKGVLSDKSTGVFNGKVIVAVDAQKIEAYQQNKNILLSREATMNAKPELEIFADDVKCSHGTTTGQFDEEAIFYLQTRGISKESAKKLLIEAFADEVIDKVDSEELRIWIKEKLD